MFTQIKWKACLFCFSYCFRFGFCHGGALLLLKIRNIQHQIVIIFLIIVPPSLKKKETNKNNNKEIKLFVTFLFANPYINELYWSHFWLFYFRLTVLCKVRCRLKVSYSANVNVGSWRQRWYSFDNCLEEDDNDERLKVPIINYVVIRIYINFIWQQSYSCENIGRGRLVQCNMRCVNRKQRNLGAWRHAFSACFNK